MKQLQNIIAETVMQSAFAGRDMPIKKASVQTESAARAMDARCISEIVHTHVTSIATINISKSDDYQQLRMRMNPWAHSVGSLREERVCVGV